MRQPPMTFEELLTRYTFLQEQRAVWEMLHHVLIRHIPTDIGEPLEVISLHNSQASVAGEEAIRAAMQQVQAEMDRLDTELGKTSKFTPHRQIAAPVVEKKRKSLLRNK